jgi:hypothetical protein
MLSTWLGSEVCVQGPVAGSVAVTTPVRSAATQSVVAGQVPDENGGKPVSTVHALAPPAGVVVVNTPVALLTTHSGSVEQNTAPNGGPGSISAVAHALRPPVGLVVVATAPSERAATHRLTDGQVIPVQNPGGAGTAAAVHADAAPVGSVDVYTALLTATHNAASLGPTQGCSEDERCSALFPHVEDLTRAADLGGGR